AGAHIGSEVERPGGRGSAAARPGRTGCGCWAGGESAGRVRAGAGAGSPAGRPSSTVSGASRIEQMAGTVEAETPEVVEHRLPGREVGGEITPGAARAQHIEDGVEDATQRVGARSTAS